MHTKYLCLLVDVYPFILMGRIGVEQKAGNELRQFAEGNLGHVLGREHSSKNENMYLNHVHGCPPTR